MYIRRDGTLVEVHAPAKLNLFLEVLAQREDGYHEIETLMAAITIFDTLTLVAQTEGRLRFRCNWTCGLEAQQVAANRVAGGSGWGDLPEGADNIVCRAVELLRARAGVESGATIRLVKRIPSCAGLGGASSDAAAALLAANLAWGLGWTCQRLAELAAELGSDIPFFLNTGGSGAAVCRGRGERVESVATRGVMRFVVVRPPAGLSTAAVYRGCRVPDQPTSVRPLWSAMQRGDCSAVGRRMTNRLEESAERLSPWIQHIRRVFSRLDCLGHQMSGSGTSYFGICRDARHARRVTGALRRGRRLGVLRPHRRLTQAHFRSEPVVRRTTMEITEVRIKLMEDSDDRLQAFCSITFDDCFVVRDLKIIEGANGPFVAMPSRKLTSHCSQCGCKNHLRSAYCNQCGGRLKESREIRDHEGRTKLYADIAHPINSECREKIQKRVISAFNTEVEQAKEPGYVSRYDDDYENDAGPAEAASVDPAPELSKERTHVEPAERGPRPPHKPPARQRASRPSRQRPKDDFGAGIF